MKKITAYMLLFVYVIIATLIVLCGAIVTLLMMPYFFFKFKKKGLTKTKDNVYGIYKDVRTVHLM